MRFLKLLAVILLVSLLAVPCFAQVPRLINYSGWLTQEKGIYYVNFELCTDKDCIESIRPNLLGIQFRTMFPDDQWFHHMRKENMLKNV